jgi:hypothetical protein
MPVQPLVEEAASVTVGGLTVTLDPTDDIATTPVDGGVVRFTDPDGTAVQGSTGIGVGILDLSLHNGTDAPATLPDPAALGPPDGTGYETGKQLDHHFEYRGEAHTSLVRLFDHRETLEPGETVGGLVPFYGAITEEGIEPLELTVEPPETGAPIRLRYGRADGWTVPDEPGGDTHVYGGCPDCGADLTGYTDPAYCPDCGRELGP